MRKKIPIIVVAPILIVFLVGSVWFVGNLIAYNKHWDGLSPALRDEWESTGEKEESPIAVFMKRGLGVGIPKGLDQFREPGVTISNLRDSVKKVEMQQRVLVAEVEAIRKEMEEISSNNGRMRSEIDAITSKTEK